MAIKHKGEPFAISGMKVENPHAGLNPAMLHTDVDSTSCNPFTPPHMVKGKLEMGRSLKGSCPIQWVWKHGKPALRFCQAKGKAGRIIPVDDAHDALKKAHKICAEWNAKKTGLPTRPQGGQYQILAAEMSDSESLKHYALGTATRKKRAAGPWKPTSIYAAETRRLEFEAWTARQVKKSKKGGSR